MVLYSKKGNVKIVLASGGNPTAVIFVANEDNRKEYALVAKRYMEAHPDVEQFGFIEGASHFQMSGGEFCGNAARAAALLLSQKAGTSTGSFTMSGFTGEVIYHVLESGEVECIFTCLPISVKNVEVEEINATLVDLGGIVHIILPASEVFKNDKVHYTMLHRKIVTALGLNCRPAVGVVWQNMQLDGSVAIHPVVWVRDIDSFFYETACGSGTLAILEASNASVMDVVQPSGQSIHSEKLESASYLLRSMMQILND